MTFPLANIYITSSKYSFLTLINGEMGICDATLKDIYMDIVFQSANPYFYLAITFKVTLFAVRKWHKFKSCTMLFVFKLMLMPLRKIWIHLFSSCRSDFG